MLVPAHAYLALFINLRSNDMCQIFECPKDISRAWHIEFPTGCNDLASLYYAMAGFNIGSDIAIFILPLPTLMGLHINRKKRSSYPPMPPGL